MSAIGLGALSAVVSLGYQVIKKNLLARRYRKTVKSLESEIKRWWNSHTAGEKSRPLLFHSTLELARGILGQDLVFKGFEMTPAMVKVAQAQSDEAIKDFAQFLKDRSATRQDAENALEAIRALPNASSAFDED